MAAGAAPLERPARWAHGTPTPASVDAARQWGGLGESFLLPRPPGAPQGPRFFPPSRRSGETLSPADSRKHFNPVESQL